MPRKVHKIHDTFVKELLSHKDSASEFIKQALPPAFHRQLDLENIRFLSDTYTTKELNQYFSDIVVKVPVSGTAGEVIVSILIEHKSTIDHYASLQLLTYMANGYAQQRKRNEKLSVIIPVIYYHGKNNWQFRPLDQLFTDLPAKFRMFIPTFQIEMFTVQQFSVQQIHRIAEAKLRAALMVQKGQFDELVAIRDYVRVINALELEATGNFFFTLFVYMFHLPRFEEEFIIDITHQLTADMKSKSMTYADVLRERGLQQGLEQGLEQGRQEGRQQGSLLSRYEFARKLLLRNMPLDEICELTDLTIEEVKRLEAD